MAPNTFRERSPTPTNSIHLKNGKGLVMTMNQFRDSCSSGVYKTNCLVAIMGKIYDVSDWIHNHPGGPLVIQSLHGKDATNHFYTSHPSNFNESYISRFQVGEITDFKQTPLQKDFYLVRQQMIKEGLFEPQTRWYIQHISLLGLLFLTSIYLGLTATTFSIYILSAFLLGVFWQQLSFMGHDFGHNSVFRNRGNNVLGGLIVSSIFGVSGAWWRRVHNVHHVVPNSREGDPDIQYLPLFAVGEKSCQDYYSFFHKRLFKFDEAAKFLVSYQHLFYIPILLAARINLQLQGTLLLWNHNIPVPNRNKEKLAQFIFFVWFALYLSAMPDLLTRVYYVLVCYNTCGIIHLQIILSHFGMDIYEGLGHDDDNSDFIRTQLATTMNVDCSTWMDWFHGGLQFQIEHHLFPRTPRPNLRIIMTKYIKPLCLKHNIQHHSLSFLGINLRVYETMKKAAVLARKHRNVAFNDSILSKILNSDG